MKRIRIELDDVARMDDLLAADFVVRDKKGYTASMRKWDANWQTNFQLLYDDLNNETYEPGPVKVEKRTMPGGKKRNVSVLMHRDNIVCEMIVQALNPVFIPKMIDRTYGNIKGRGPLKCQEKLIRYVKQINDPYFLWADVTKFFESVNYEVMYNAIARKIKGAKLLRLIYKILFHHGHLLIGARHSPLFGNILMSALDRYIIHDLKLESYVRYCDDLIIVHQDKKVLHTAKRDIEQFLFKRKLNLNGGWTVRPVDAQGIDFLGSVIYSYKVRLRTKTKKRHERRLAKLNKKPQPSIKEDRYMASLNGILKHRDTYGLLNLWRKRYENVFKRRELRQAARIIANEQKRQKRILADELQRNGDCADELIRRGVYRTECAI